MQHSFYLLGLLISLGCLALIDHRYRLAIWNSPKIAAKVLAIGLLFFIAWDVAGIQLDIFYSGQSQYALGWYIIKDFPVEELFFLTLLLYTPLVLSCWLERRHV